MSVFVPILADIGAKALYLLYLWLLSAIGASELSRRKGYGEKWGLGTGLMLSLVGLIVWLFVPCRPGFERGPGVLRLVPGRGHNPAAD
jgi:hypothetical protein